MSNEEYVRTDAELAHQRNYEAREQARHSSVVQIVYAIDEVDPPPSSLAGERHKGKCWIASRHIGEEKTGECSPSLYRRVEADDWVRSAVRRDRLAAKRLGVVLHVTEPPR